MLQRMLLCFLGVAPLISVATLQAADGQTGVKVSSYAPAKEAESQLRDYVDRIERDLKDADSYGVDQSNRVALNAATVSVLALSLGMHDEDAKYRRLAPKLIELSRGMADESDDFDAVKSKLAELKQTLASGTGDEETVWEPVAELYLLMKQVPIVNNMLRRGVDSRRFDRSAERTAGHAVTLAAIAQASLIDTTYCGDEADEEEWKRICADMRDAAADVYRALLDKNQVKARAGNARIVKTCDECHEKFR